MNKLFIYLFIPIIGFSQCENPILDEAVINEQADDDFQLIITLFAQDLLAIDSNINDCNSPNNYTMFLPSDNVPSAAVGQLVGLTGDIADYLSYYVYPSDLVLEPNQNLTLQMLDGNEAIVNTLNEPPTVNNIDISGVLCACNGIIYLIDNLIWAPGAINIDENIKPSFNINHSTNQINIITNNDYGILSIITLNGQVIYKKPISKDSNIKLPRVKSGGYLIKYQSDKYNFSELYFF